ncbi:MAG: hypothetical protein J6W15_03735 [Clostridia bacterium]|nr:hypothetical protein [Clostridia bacterium]MBO7246198.1 hypothetical protein [Clostridia bacterium]
MRIYIISAICLLAVLRVFCALLLRDKTFLQGDSRSVFVTAVCTALCGAGGSAAGGYLCMTFFGGLLNSTMLTVFSAVCAAVLGVAAIFVSKKMFGTEASYMPAILLLPVMSAIMTAVGFSGETLEALIINSALSCICFGGATVIWHGIILNSKKLKMPYIFEGLSVLAVLITVFSAV